MRSRRAARAAWGSALALLVTAAAALGFAALLVALLSTVG
jgi:hypothetical protein